MKVRALTERKGNVFTTILYYRAKGSFKRRPPIAGKHRSHGGSKLNETGPHKENVPRKYFLTEKAIAGIARKKEKSQQRGAGFGAQMLNIDRPSYTIPARYWKDGYDALVKYSDTEIRRLMIIELKRIQSFPDDFILCGSDKEKIMQIGNAVACTFAYHLGLHVIKYIKTQQ